MPQSRQFIHIRYFTSVAALLIQLVAAPGLLRGQVSVPSQPPLTIPLTVPFNSPAEPQTMLPSGAGAADVSFTVRTDLLSPFVNRQTVQGNNVATRVLEADVRGCQTTTTSIQLESVDCPDMARLNFLATGHVATDTVGFTPQARVKTLGNHVFNVTKPVYFDGLQFLTKPAFGRLQARQVPTAVNSVATGMPLLGPIGDQIAWKEVYRRMPASDAITVRRVADDVLPKVNSGVDNQLVRLNTNWRTVREVMDLTFDGPLSWSTSSTARDVTVAVKNPAVSPVVSPTGMTLTSTLDPAEVAAVTLSEAAVNHWLERQPLAGLTISDASFQKILAVIQQAEKDPQRIISELRNIGSLAAEPLLFSVRLAQQTPIALSFDKALLVLSLKFQVLPKSAPAGQMQLMRIQLGGQSETAGGWSLSLSGISVEPADSSEVPDAWTTLLNNQSAQIVNNAKPLVLPRKIDLQDRIEKLPVLRIHRIQSEGGWLRVGLRLDEATGQITTRRR